MRGQNQSTNLLFGTRKAPVATETKLAKIQAEETEVLAKVKADAIRAKKHIITELIEHMSHRNASYRLRDLYKPFFRAYTDDEIDFDVDGDDVVLKLDNGDFLYFSDKELHREDGPAIRYTTPSWQGARVEQYWYQVDLLHREDGPAVENLYEKTWYQYGRMHRTNGPARMQGNNLENHEYHVDGKFCKNRKDYIRAVGKYLDN